MKFFRKWISPADALHDSSPAASQVENSHSPVNADEICMAVRNQYQDGDDAAAHRNRLLAQIMAEGSDCAAAYELILDEIAKLRDPEERAHALHHEVRYLTTYVMTPPGPGNIVDIAASDIYIRPLSALKMWAIQSIPALAINYETDRLPFPDGSADGVLFCEVLEHFVLDPLHCMIEINRILKPGGFVILTTPNAASWFSIYRALYQLHPSRWPVYVWNAPNSRNHIHAREYLTSEVELLLHAAGFGNITTLTRDYGIAPSYRPLAGFGQADRGETIFARAYKEGLPRKRSIKPIYLQDVDFEP
jgi:SAM-dependent methyltransferase